MAAPEEPGPYRNGHEPHSLFRMPRPDQDMPKVPYPALEVPSFQQEGGSLQTHGYGTADDTLISPALGASVMSAFETLAATVVLQNTEMLERTMRELLRPLVKTWLDENLPTLVERLVRVEIERVARGARG